MTRCSRHWSDRNCSDCQRPWLHAASHPMALVGDGVPADPKSSIYGIFPRHGVRLLLIVEDHLSQSDISFGICY